MQRRPLVSVGLPVFNGERYLADAIESLLAQTLEDLELVICDNASTDATMDICGQYASDPRVRYIRHATNIGGFANHNKVFELSIGKYFAWAAHDDLRAPTNLEKCVSALERDPGAVLCYTETLRIEADGRQIKEPEDSLDLQHADPCARFRALIRQGYRMEPIYGVIRAEALKKTGLMGSYADSDRNLLAELGLAGRFLKIPEPLFLRREHEGRSTVVYPSRQVRMTWIDPSRPRRFVFPYFRQFFEMTRGVVRSPVSTRDKLRCTRHLGWWIVTYRDRLRSDLKYALLRLLGRIPAKSNGHLGSNNR